MQKLCSVVGAILVASTAIGASVTYEGTLGDGTTPFSEFFADTKGSASSKTPWVHPTNVVNLASKESARLIKLQQSNGAVDSSDLPYGGIWPTGYTFKDYVDYVWKASILALGEKEDALYAKIGPFSNVSTNVFGVKKGNVAIGEGANAATDAYGLPCGIVAINPYGTYPSYAYGSFNTVIGIDNIVGDATRTPDKTAYSVAVGVSDKALGMHSYAFGSQLNVITNNATAIGYGLTALHPYSTVIGHGHRPSSSGTSYDYNGTAAEVATYLTTVRNNIFPGFHLRTTDTHQILTITECLSSPIFGMYYKYVITNESDYPDGIPDWVLGQYDWRYGISHGPGTYNIVTWHSNYGTKSPGLKAVYINGDPLDELVRKEIAGPNVELTNAQKSKNIGFNGSGYDENSPVELGVNASAALDPTVVAGVTTSGTKLRNAGIAIGAQAKAEGANNLKNQSIAIGLAAHSKGSSMVAIGPGAREVSETEWTGNSTYAEGSATTAIGYSTKAYGSQAVALGGGDSGTGKPATVASNNYTVAVGAAAQAVATKAVALGRYAKAEAEGAVQIGTGTNSTPNSLQFMGVKIVDNGRLVGGSADPKEAVISSDVISASGGEISINLEPGSISTILPEANCGPGTELMVEAPVGGLRNYEVYLPNEPEMCAGLPAGFSLDELPTDIKRVYANNKWQAHKLPARIIIKQPYSRLVIGEIVEFDDGTDWSPIITDAHIKWDGSKFTTDGNKFLEGTNLHSGVSLKIAYRISGGSIVTNTVYGASNLNDQGILDGTFYNYTISTEFVPPSGQNPSPTGGTVVPITLIYETKCGKRPGEFTVDLDLAP